MRTWRDIIDDNLALCVLAVLFVFVTLVGAAGWWFAAADLQEAGFAVALVGALDTIVVGIVALARSRAKILNGQETEKGSPPQMISE